MSAQSEQQLFEACLDAAERCGARPPARQRASTPRCANASAGCCACTSSLRIPCSAAMSAEVPRVAVPHQVGPYRILESLGEGAMGEVYLAEQQVPVRRRVALKILKFGLGSREVIARFELERQTLAILGHPNIARILDAGTTDDGRPFFAMEYVAGIPITQYCDEHKFSLQAAHRSFRASCAAACSTRICAASSIATSSLRTSWSPRSTASSRRRSSTSASPRRPPSWIPRAMPTRASAASWARRNT